MHICAHHSRACAMTYIIHVVRRQFTPRRQLTPRNWFSSSTFWNPRNRTQVSMFRDKGLYLLSHLAGFPKM